VRDIAVDLVGKYIVQKPSLATEYYRHIADRIEVSTHLKSHIDDQDSGVGVRKRVIKLLTGIFSTVADSAIRTDICCRMIGAMDDSDDGVKVRSSHLCEHR
jgi:cohesin loading factor subunit SCC2